VAGRELSRASFLRDIAGRLFGGALTDAAAEHISGILDYWDSHYPGAPDAQLAYILATVLAEVGADMAPVRETFALDDAQARARLCEAAYAQDAGPCGHAYYGRGYVQLTWHENYARQAEKLGVPLVEEPDLALDPLLALRILVDGMMEGDFNPTGQGLTMYVGAELCDFEGARNTVNLQNRAGPIAEDACAFLAALRAARGD